MSVICFLFYTQIFISPIAPKIKATGTSNTNPPTNTRHTMNMGTASIIRIVAIIFVMPHVILSAMLIAFASKQIVSIDIIISIIVITPFYLISVFE